MGAFVHPGKWCHKPTHAHEYGCRVESRLGSLPAIAPACRGTAGFSSMASYLLACLFAVGIVVTLAQPDAGYTREELESLTKFRQQHRLTQIVPHSAIVVVVVVAAEA